ncbi:hypothetical protein L6452_24839 [Arctium lappa]|uniref:Uncharacterized protein n=1 Tax=Arctium lappa TaxID=4217 RepID=A0ACB9AA26_ARCLA|nr:hypothetical protein L6452_24839 [Arctium lappa]
MYLKDFEKYVKKKKISTLCKVGRLHPPTQDSTKSLSDSPCYGGLLDHHQLLYFIVHCFFNFDRISPIHFFLPSNPESLLGESFILALPIKQNSIFDI